MVDLGRCCVCGETATLLIRGAPYCPRHGPAVSALNAAGRDLGRAILATREGRALLRFMTWLNDRLARART